MISILEDQTRVANGRAEFVVASSSIEELLSASTANAVLQKAAEVGLNRPGVSSVSGPYPVDAEGKTDDELMTSKRGPVAGYRRDFVVLASI